MDEVCAANNRLRSQHRGADFGVTMRNAYTGSNFDDFLAEEGVLAEVTARAYKRLWDLQYRALFRAAGHAARAATADENVAPAAGLSSRRSWQSGGLRYRAIFRADGHAARRHGG